MGEGRPPLPRIYVSRRHCSFFFFHHVNFFSSCQFFDHVSFFIMSVFLSCQFFFFMSVFFIMSVFLIMSVFWSGQFGSVPIKDKQTPTPPLSFDHYQIIDNRIWSTPYDQYNHTIILYCRGKCSIHDTVLY